MDVDLLLGTEQALMLHSISTNNIIPCIFDVAVHGDQCLSCCLRGGGGGAFRSESSMAVVHVMCLQWLPSNPNSSLTYSSGQY